jgi:tetratricopeptide (TPR) repeat protein
MTKPEIEEHSHALLALFKSNLLQKDYAGAVGQLTLLSHCNIRLLNKQIKEILENEAVGDEAFRLAVALFVSEQKLNEQRIEDAQLLIQNAISKSNVTGNSKTLVLALLQKAVLNIYLNLPQESSAIFEQCEHIAGQMADNDLTLQVYIYGYHFYSESDTAKAGEYLYKALELAGQCGNSYYKAYALLHLGTLNTILQNNDVALGFFQESLVLFKQLKLNICMADNRMCQFNVYYRNQNFEKAIACLNDVIEWGGNCGWDHKIAICYGNLSAVYLRLERYEEARAAAQKDIDMSTGLNNMYNVGVATYRLGKIEAVLGNTTGAIELLSRSVQIRKNQITNTQLVHVYEELFPLHALVGDYKSAFEVQSALMKLKVDLMNAEKAKENEAQRARYEADRREAELREVRLLQTESELKALKAQMNPHFIFNALNSIQEIFFLGDKRLANKHLARFSQLMRSILRASGKKTITLQEEVSMLQEYLLLEALRFGAQFEYTIVVDEDVDAYTLDVPPMVVQPFVENAVKHGLLHKEGHKKLEITIGFNEQEQSIIVVVSDNGIGRKASMLINQHRSNHESFSTSAIEKRFEILNSGAAQNHSFTYHDLLSPLGEPLGTQVSIVLPVTN